MTISRHALLIPALVLVTALVAGADEARPRYPWPREAHGDTIATRFAPPPGYVRVAAEEGGFGQWLRGLPLLPGKPPVRLYNGAEKGNQRAHAAVVDIDVGERDLQQCADAVMRLRAEYLRSSGQGGRICFRSTSGSPAAWSAWSKGQRPNVQGNRVSWEQTARPGGGYRTFRRYLTWVFRYAGTASLERELRPVPADQPVEIGDVFIEGGFPGHAVIVVDVAENPAGRRVFLIAQSYMPAQQLHVLVNHRDDALSPWHHHEPGAGLATPEWGFGPGTLRRFPARGCGR